jgi:hypothetical protein
MRNTLAVSQLEQRAGRLRAVGTKGDPSAGDLIEPGDRIIEMGQVLPDLCVDGGRGGP